MHVALLFPAATDPRSPHLAVPSLAASLRANGIRVTMRDVDVEGLHHVLRRDSLVAAADQHRRREAPDDETASQHHQLTSHLAWLVDHTSGALDALRDHDAFLDPDRHHQARRTIAMALELVSATRPGVHYTITGADYAVDGVDTTRLSHLLEVTADNRYDLFDDLHRSVVDDLDDDRPDLVGISILNRQQVIPGLMLARRCREAGHTVVLGGTVYAKFHDALLSRPRFFEAFCDAVIPYEGETALRSLTEAIESGRTPTQWGDVPNVLSLDVDGRVVAGPTLVEDVRSLPTPDFHGMPLDLYLNPVTVLPIVTGKGCYFNRCKFCDIPSINRIATKPYRIRDPEQIAADVATLFERHGARHFEITDEALAPKLLLRLADALDAYPDLAPRFVGYARFEPGFTPETCRRMHDMGMRKLFFGLESGNQAMLDHMAKGIRVPVAHEVLRNCAAAGIATHVFSIVGFPEETEAQARDTLGFLLDSETSLRHPRNSFDVHPFGLDLRTEYGDEPARFGIELAPTSNDASDVAFPISLKDWRNTRGLSQDDAARLLEEFALELRDRYHGTRLYPEQQWPGYEEYAVVYGDHYDGRPFGWRMALPEPESPERFTLMFADHVWFEPFEGAQIVHTLSGDVVASTAAVEVLGPARPPQRVDEYLDALIDAAPQFAGADGALRRRLHDELRGVIDALLAARALWLRPDHAELVATASTPV